MVQPANAFGWLLASRPRVVLITLGLLVLLDLGRSTYTRIGYSQPVEHWQPDPRVYADLSWPPGSDLPPDAPLGARVYAQHCAVCHGPDGRGNGPAAPSMVPRPRDFTLGQFEYKSTPPGEPPSDADLTKIIAEGLHESAMPYWGDLLSRDEIQSVVAYIKGLFKRFYPAPKRHPHGVTRALAQRAKHRARQESVHRAQLRGLPRGGRPRGSDAARCQGLSGSSRGT